MNKKLKRRIKNKILVYLLNEKIIKGLQGGEKYSLRVKEEDLIIMCLDKNSEVDYAWHTENKEIIDKIKSCLN